jgi:hypothetical protein
MNLFPFVFFVFLMGILMVVVGILRLQGKFRSYPGPMRALLFPFLSSDKVNSMEEGRIQIRAAGSCLIMYG